MLLVRHDEQCLEPAEHAVGAPVLRQLDGGTGQVRRVAFQLLFELFEECERICRRAGETGEDLAAPQGAHLVGVRFHHGLPDRDLAIAADGHFAVAANAENCRAMYDWQHS